MSQHIEKHIKMYQFIIVVIDYLVSWCALTETKYSFTLVKGKYSFYL